MRKRPAGVFVSNGRTRQRGRLARSFWKAVVRRELEEMNRWPESIPLSEAHLSKQLFL